MLIYSCVILRMNESQNPSDQTKFRLNEINKIKNYFNSEIQEREAISKKLSKYIAALIMLTKFLLFYLHLLVL